MSPVPGPEVVRTQGVASDAPRLLLVTTVASTLEAFLVPYARHFRERGWHVDALAAGATSAPVVASAFDAAYDIGWTRQPGHLGSALTAPRRVREVVRGGAYDIVHVHTPVAGALTRFALRNMPGRPRIVYTAHGFHFGNGLPRVRGAVVRAVERAAARWTDAVVVINEEDLGAARALGTIDSSRVHLFHGIGIDPDAYANVSPAAVRDELGLGPDARIVLSVAELSRRKRPLDAVDALVGLPASVHLLLAGDGPLHDVVVEHARRRGVESRVHLLGFRPDAAALIRAADAVLLCSSQEGLPRSVMEAMAAGTPVVGTDVRGTRDLLQGGAGVLVPVDDTHALAAALTRVLVNATFASGLTRVARERVAGVGSPYQLERILSDHEHLYQRILADAAPR